MIRSILQTKGYELEAADGRFGKVGDFLFDEALWVIRYLVADTGGWLTGRRVLLPPAVLDQPRWRDRTVPVKLRKEDIESSPSIDEHAPVHRQQEIKLHRFWDVQPYWVGGIPAGIYPIPKRAAEDKDEEFERQADENADPYLRSVNEVKGYSISATDDGIGEVSDFLVDDELWVIRYLVVDTLKWLPGKKVLVPLIWITDISWAEKSVSVDVTREIVKNSPEFDPALPINREQEEVLYDYYGRPKYWLAK
jgi:hypothetical protein